jgi:hypothetical protein
LTDNVLPKGLGPKRATKKFFNLGKEDDVRKYVVRREVTSAKEGECEAVHVHQGVSTLPPPPFPLRLT